MRNVLRIGYAVPISLLTLCVSASSVGAHETEHVKVTGPYVAEARANVQSPDRGATFAPSFASQGSGGGSGPGLPYWSISMVSVNDANVTSDGTNTQNVTFDLTAHLYRSTEGVADIGIVDSDTYVGTIAAGSSQALMMRVTLDGARTYLSPGARSVWSTSAVNRHSDWASYADTYDNHNYTCLQP